MSNLSTLPKGDSAWLLRKAIQRIIQQVSVLETNIGSSTTGNSANTQVIFNDNGVLRGDSDFIFNAALNKLVALNIESTAALVVGTSATITGDLTVDTSTLKVDSANNRVGIGTASPGLALDIVGSVRVTYGQSYNSFTSGGSNSPMLSCQTFDSVGNIVLIQNPFSDVVIGTSTTGTSTERYRVSSNGGHTWSNVGGAGAAMTLNSNGLGLGVAPSAWNAIYKTFQFGPTGAAASSVSNDLYLTNNVFWNSANSPRYIVNGKSTFYYQDSGNHSWWTAGTGTAGNAITFTQAMTLDASGNLALGNGNLVMSTAGKGIDFSATTSGSGTMTSELLSDYEEGTWTGTIGGATTNPTTPVTSTGRYTKIGRQVFIEINFYGDTTGASGRITVSGLPFTSNASMARPGAILMDNMGTFTGSPIAYLAASDTSVALYASNSNGAISNVTHNAGAGRALYLELTYTV